MADQSSDASLLDSSIMTFSGLSSDSSPNTMIIGAVPNVPSSSVRAESSTLVSMVQSDETQNNARLNRRLPSVDSTFDRPVTMTKTVFKESSSSGYGPANMPRGRMARLTSSRRPSPLEDRNGRTRRIDHPARSRSHESTPIVTDVTNSTEVDEMKQRIDETRARFLLEETSAIQMKMPFCLRKLH